MYGRVEDVAAGRLVPLLALYHCGLSDITFGVQCYMAPHEGEDDPAVYNSGVKRRNKGLGETAAENEADEAEDDEDEETLLVAQPGFNRLLVVLRDPGVLRFVKYVSAEAPGCRWDVCGEWEVGDSADSEEGSTGPDENE